MSDSPLSRMAAALHADRDHTRDGVELGQEPICNCYSLAIAALPVAFALRAEAVRAIARQVYNGASDPFQRWYDEGVGQWLHLEADALELTRPNVDTPKGASHDE